jgi:hypothetical protein
MREFWGWSWSSNLVRVESAENHWRIYRGDTPILDVVGNETNLLTGEVYLMAEPLGDLTTVQPSEWKKLHEIFSLLCPDLVSAVCENETSSRFLEFFGFKKVGATLGRSFYVRIT